MTHIYASVIWVSIGSDNGLSPDRCQAIIWTNAGILLIWPLGTTLSETSIVVYISSFKEMHLKMLSVKCHPFFLSLNVLGINQRKQRTSDIMPIQNSLNFADNIFKCLNEDIWISTKMSLKYNPKKLFDKLWLIPLLVGWHWAHIGLKKKSYWVEILSHSKVNSLWPSDAIWRQRSGSTSAQVMACCLTAPSHYLNQCWLIISKVEWHSSKGEFTSDTSAINHWNYLEN